MQIANYN